MTGRHTDNTMKDIDAQNILEAYEAVDSETGERMSPDKHAKAVQWTKDIKAKLAKAQEIGDSKEANKLQRYLDMHGIDEADAPYDGLDDQNRRAEDEHENLLKIRQAFDGKDFIGWAGDKMREVGKEAFEAKWAAFIQDLEGNADDTGKGYDDAPGIRKWKATHKTRGYIPGHHD